LEPLPIASQHKAARLDPLNYVPGFA
jgi:hypothetical protein